MKNSLLPYRRLKTTIALFLIIPWSLFLSCTGDPQKPEPLSTRDSLLQDYFKATRSSPNIDTLWTHFTLLKAYYENDTTSLRKLHDEIIDNLKIRNEYLDARVCEAPLGIHFLNYEEAYRFTYGAAFCDTSIVITVGKRKTNIILHVVLYEHGAPDDKCRVIQQFGKSLDEEAWIKLCKGIDFVDFWGLSVKNEKEGVDGSSLHVYGYEGNTENAFIGRYKGIFRWAPEETAIGVLFKDVLDLSGIKVRCFHYDGLHK